MMNQIKAVFFDVDGTLLSHKARCVPQSALKAVRRLREQGILTFISTGRHQLELDVIPRDQIRFDGYCILNGQMCLDSDMQPFFETPITGRDRDRLLELYDGDSMSIMLVARSGLYLNRIDDHVRVIMKSVPASGPQLGGFDGGDIFMACSFGLREDDEKITALFDGLKLTRWHEHSADIIPRDAGKIQGIRQFLDRYGLSPEEIMAFGDSENDAEMLAFAGTGVAMGNALEEIKAIADYVTADIDDDGVWKGLAHFGLV